MVGRAKRYKVTFDIIILIMYEPFANSKGLLALTSLHLLKKYRHSKNTVFNTK